MNIKHIRIDHTPENIGMEAYPQCYMEWVYMVWTFRYLLHNMSVTNTWVFICASILMHLPGCAHIFRLEKLGNIYMKSSNFHLLCNCTGLKINMKDNNFIPRGRQNCSSNQYCGNWIVFSSLLHCDIRKTNPNVFPDKFPLDVDHKSWLYWVIKLQRDQCLL